MSLTPGLKTLPECSTLFTYMSSVEHWSARLVLDFHENSRLYNTTGSV